MENNELNALKNVKTIVDCAKIIYGINYTNGRIKKQIIEYCLKNYSIDIIEILKNNNKNYCLNCGKEIPKMKKFCNSSCAATYNNKGRKHSEETKEKIKKSLQKYYKTETLQRSKSGKIKYECVCKSCGNIFYSTKKTCKFCSITCSSSDENIKNKIKEKVKERILNNTFSGWKSRNIKSYPEEFFEGVLFNNNISFKKEDFSTKKYFLDFLIEKNNVKIDLEIDGKQHNYTERKKHDLERDSYLSNLGFIVYRIPWNEINTENGKNEMKEKINNFIKFYNSI